ncbi:MAG TPA: FHA domain-containing protein, partial [Polyangiaceae bacterium]|nr:FHA domain-containing protein [Polyangiaceae bacterium]
VAAENMIGRDTLYQPGVHYFATRLFDLDFARLGAIEPSPTREQIVDFPRGTGTIAYRKLVIEDGRLIGVLMIGERTAKVRATGRALKRLIDARIDVSSIKSSLLDPSFDFEGFIHTQKLLEKPPERPATAVMPASKVRGTQVINLRGKTELVDSQVLSKLDKVQSATAVISRSGSTSVLPSLPQVRTSLLPASAPASAGGTLSIASTPGMTGRGTKMLSIGLQAEAPPPPPSGLKELDARLEGLGRSWRIERSALSIGQSPECDVVVSDALVSSVHAQVVRYGDLLYLRDAGSRTGTWINGELSAAAHRLADGDSIRIGQSELGFRSSVLKPEASRIAGAGSAVPHLEVRSGASLGLSFALASDAVVIGSAAGSAIFLGDHGVAPQHARIRGQAEQHLLSDLGSGFGTSVRGGWLAAGQELLLQEGDAIRVGSVDLIYSRRALAGAAAMLRPKAKLSIASGPSAGQELMVGERLILGSAAGVSLVMPELSAQHLEVVQHGPSFWVRDLSGGFSFRSGSPLTAEFVALSHGDLLLLGGGTMLRFEEVP